MYAVCGRLLETLMNNVVNTNKEVRFTVTIALESEGMCQKI